MNVQKIQELMLRWINVPAGKPAKAVWGEIEQALNVLANTAPLAYQNGYKDAWLEPCPNCGHVKDQELDNGEAHERG